MISSQVKSTKKQNYENEEDRALHYITLIHNIMRIRGSEPLCISYRQSRNTKIYKVQCMGTHVPKKTITMLVHSKRLVAPFYSTESSTLPTSHTMMNHSLRPMASRNCLMARTLGRGDRASFLSQYTILFIHPNDLKIKQT
jgi:hypothetical protein